MVMSQYSLRLTSLVKGEILDNFIHIELVKVCIIDFDVRLYDCDWLGLIHNVFLEFNRILSSLLQKLGLIELTVQTVFNVLVGRTIYRAYVRRSDADVLPYIFLIPPDST